MDEKRGEEHVVDARALRCPLPVLKARKALMARAPGALIRLIATDGAAWVDVPHFCAQAGHELVEARETPDGAEFLIRRGAVREGEDGG